MVEIKDFLSPPNIVSLIRILMAPVLLSLAYYQYEDIFFIVLIFTLFTDVLDGFLARHLNMITELGSHLDSWGDFIIYTTLAIAAWWLWPETIKQEYKYVLAIILSFTLPVIIGFVKFRTLTSYHTWSVKFAVFITLMSFIAVFWIEIHWPIYLAAALSVIAAIEEISITIIMKHEHADVRSFYHALRYGD